MNAPVITEDVVGHLRKRYGKSTQITKGQVFTFGTSLSTSINYSKLLGGHKYFYAVPSAMIDSTTQFPKTELGEFAIFICGVAERLLIIPRTIIAEMLRGVPTRRVDIFEEDGSFILQTTKHPKLNVTEFLNAFPSLKKHLLAPPEEELVASKDRLHVKMQSFLIRLGQAEGCSVWVPIPDRNLSYQQFRFSQHTLAKLPNFGFEENTRRIIQNIDVLWLKKNIIQKAIEVESTTSIYSGLLRLNDLVMAQPNNQIDLYIAASERKRPKVFGQLTRPSFQSLLPVCRFISFEGIEEQYKRLDAFGAGVRVSGLLAGERFTVPEHLLYPKNL